VSKVDRSTWEAAWRDRAEVEQTYSNDDRILHNLKGLLDLDGAIVLEVGGGSGRDGLGLVGAGATVCELDYAEASLRIMRRIGEGKQRFRVVGGDATSLPFPDGAFDVVFHQGLLEHFRPDDARALLQENIRVLAPGGLLLVDVPQRWHPYTLLKHALMAVNKWFAGWERSFSMGELKRVLRDEGLEVVHTYGAWMYPSLPYRVVREALKWVGLYLPLHPPRVPVLCSLRDAARRTLGRSKLPLVTGISIGVVARKTVGTIGDGPIDSVVTLRLTVVADRPTGGRAGRAPKRARREGRPHPPASPTLRPTRRRP
jgi:SAM-dependent methyltransferase